MAAAREISFSEWRDRNRGAMLHFAVIAVLVMLLGCGTDAGNRTFQPDNPTSASGLDESAPGEPSASRAVTYVSEAGFPRVVISVARYYTAAAHPPRPKEAAPRGLWFRPPAAPAHC